MSGYKLLLPNYLFLVYPEINHVKNKKYLCWLNLCLVVQQYISYFVCAFFDTLSIGFHPPRSISITSSFQRRQQTIVGYQVSSPSPLLHLEWQLTTFSAITKPHHKLANIDVRQCDFNPSTSSTSSDTLQPSKLSDHCTVPSHRHVHIGGILKDLITCGMCCITRCCRIC